MNGINLKLKQEIAKEITTRKEKILGPFGENYYALRMSLEDFNGFNFDRKEIPLIGSDLIGSEEVIVTKLTEDAYDKLTIRLS